MTRAVIAGVGSALPNRIVRNEHFAPIGGDDEWIIRRTGIVTRRWLEPGTRLSTLAAEACAKALSDAEVSAQQVDRVVVATVTGDDVTPSVAGEVAAALGIPGFPGAFDLSAACAGFLYALDYGFGCVESGRAACVLACGAEALSRFIDHGDRATAPLFADGAGAVVITAAPGRCAECVDAVVLASDGRHTQDLVIERKKQRVEMNGRVVFEHAVERMEAAMIQVAEITGTSPAALDLLVAHQANARIVAEVRRRLGVPDDRAPLYIDRFGNTSAASIPMALAEAESEGRLPAGARVGLTAFGAGFTWGAGIVTWKECVHA